MTKLLETHAVINTADAVAIEATNRLATANSVELYRNATDFLSKNVADQKEAIGKSKDFVLEYPRDVNAESDVAEVYLLPTVHKADWTSRSASKPSHEHNWGNPSTPPIHT